MNKIIISRHEATEKFIKQELPEFKDAPVKASVDITDVEGVFESSDLEGKKFDELSYSQLNDVIFEGSTKPGTYCLIDKTAVDILERSNIRAVVLDGNEEKEIERAVFGGHSGTVIRSMDE